MSVKRLNVDNYALKMPQSPVWGYLRLFLGTDIHEVHITPIYCQSQASSL